MADLIIELRKLDLKLRRREHPLVGPASLTVGMINGGCAINMVPNYCSIRVDRRSLPDETEGCIIKAFEKVFLRLKKRDDNLKWKFIHTLTFHGMGPYPWRGTQWSRRYQKRFNQGGPERMAGENPSQLCLRHCVWIRTGFCLVVHEPFTIRPGFLDF